MTELEDLKTKKQELLEQFNDPAVASNPDKVKNISKELSQLESRIAKAKENSTSLAKIKGVLLEIRAGAGGEEAAIFARDLLEMYQKFAEKQNWKTKILEEHQTGMGGFREVVLEIKNPESWDQLQFEAGTHRVQRVPETEKSDRIHTSTATVAVLPEPEELNIEVNPQDIRMDTFRASGKGGQHVNVTDSAVRMTHHPTGLVASSQSERSQHQNRERAMHILKTKIYQQEREKQIGQEEEMRKQAVGSAARSEKIRTYNFPQDRVTDHRAQETWHNLENIFEGNIEPILETISKSNNSKSKHQISK